MVDLQTLGAMEQHKPEQMSEEELRLLFLELRASRIRELMYLEDYLLEKQWIKKRKVVKH